MKNIILEKQIINKDLCIGCCACQMQCPKEIIKVEVNKGFYKATINKKARNKCTYCQLCSKVCPMMEKHKTIKHNNALIDPVELTTWLVGDYKKFYVGYSTNNDIRTTSSSGGICTTIIINFLQKNEDSSVLLATPSENPLKHKLSLIKDPTLINNYSDTIYCQIDYLQAWDAILNAAKKKLPLLIIGVPCFLKSVKLFLKLNHLNSSSFFMIGLFCGGSSSLKTIKHLTNLKLGPNSNFITKISYRSGLWPERRMTATTNDDNKKETRNLLCTKNSIKDKLMYKFLFGGFFYPKGCLTCKDQTSEVADISLGDAWLDETIKTDALGSNVIITRTELGDNFLNDLIKNKKVHAIEKSYKIILESQADCLIGRKLGLWAAHINKCHVNNSMTLVCKKHFKEFFPTNKKLFERRFIRLITSFLPVRVAYLVFLFYTIIFNIPLILKKLFTKICHPKK